MKKNILIFYEKKKTQHYKEALKRILNPHFSVKS